jgi:hypothetical protein
MLRPVALAAAAALALASGAAHAGEPVSKFTRIDLKKCKSIDRSEQGASWICKGLKGYSLYVAEGDLRMFVGFGDRYKDQRASTQTLSAFNSLFEKNGTTTVEWRLKDGVPYAAIIRYNTQSDASGTMLEGQVLVVSKVGPRNGKDACHVAYIDALANPDANALAVQAADTTAPTFPCAKDPIVMGQSGKSPM